MKNWLKRNLGVPALWAEIYRLETSVSGRIKALEDTLGGVLPVRWPDGPIRLSDRQFERIAERLLDSFTVSVRELREDVDLLKKQSPLGVKSKSRPKKLTVKGKRKK